MKKQFLEEMKEQKDDEADKKSDEDETETRTEHQSIHPTLKDLLDEQEKFPNFPTNNEVTNRTPRDYSSTAHSSTLSRVSAVTTPSYPNPSSVSTSSYSGGGN